MSPEPVTNAAAVRGEKNDALGDVGYRAQAADRPVLRSDLSDHISWLGNHHACARLPYVTNLQINLKF
jgi:hypothetical protein